MARTDRAGLTASITHLRQVFRLPAVAGVALTLWAADAGAQNSGAELAQALRDGTFDLNFRYRYEFVDQADFARDANASTLWTRLIYESAAFRGFAVTLNLDDVHTIGANNYNSTRNGKIDYPLAPDPTGTDLNRASIKYTGLEGAEMVFGRQRIKRSNDRMISNVPWRQNETTYDAASISYAVNDRLRVFYSYASRVNRAFGPDSGAPAATFDGPVHLLDATYTLGPALSVMGYGYWLDFDDAPEAPMFSTRTLGVRVSGDYSIGERWSLTYVGEVARQSDIGSNPNSYDVGYTDLEIGLAREGFSLRAAYEVLGGGDAPGRAMQTPLGLVHAFQGWADKFAVTPPGGVEDFYIAATANALRGAFSLTYHDFSAETGGDRYGDEWDFSATWSFAERYSVWTGFARYRAESFSADTDKVWVMLAATF